MTPPLPFMIFAAVILLGGGGVLVSLFAHAGSAPLARLRDGAARLQARGLDPACAWSALLMIVALALPAALASWTPRTDAATPVASGALLAQPLIIYLCMLAVAAACAWRGRGPLATFGIARGRVVRDLRAGVRYGLALVAVVTLISVVTQMLWRGLGLDTTPQETFGWLADETLPVWARAGIVLIVAAAAPVAEEALFRGVLLAALAARTRIVLALLLQGALFAAAHGHAPSAIPLMVAGIGFGAGYVATGSLLTPVMMHVLFNGTSLIFFILWRSSHL